MVWLLSIVSVGCGSQRPDFSSAGSLSTREGAADSEEESDDEEEGSRAAALIAGSGAEEDEPIEEEAASDTDAGVDDEIEQEQSLSDDSTRCGDGVLDDNEMCDIALPAGADGACPTRCRPEPGCPAETMVVRSCWSYCVPDEVPPPECVD